MRDAAKETKVANGGNGVESGTALEGNTTSRIGPRVSSQVTTIPDLIGMWGEQFLGERRVVFRNYQEHTTGEKPEGAGSCTFTFTNI